MAATIGALQVKLGLVTVEWDQATAKAKNQAKDLQKAFGNLSGELQTLYSNFKLLGGITSAGALGLSALMSSTLAFSNEVKDLASAYDLSIAKTLQFRDAIQTSGGNAEQAAKMLSTMFSKIAEAQGGNEKAIFVIEKLGISFKELSTLKPEEAINRIAAGFKNITNQAERTKIIKEIYGKGGVSLDLAELSVKVSESAEKFNVHAKSIQRFGEVSDNLKTTMDYLKIAFADLVAPFLGNGLVSIEKFKAAFLSIASVVAIQNLAKIIVLAVELRNVIVSGAVVTAALTGNFVGLGAAIAGVAVYFGAQTFFSDPIKRLNNEIAEAEAGLERLKNPTKAFATKQKAAGITPDMNAETVAFEEARIAALKKELKTKNQIAGSTDEGTIATKRESDALKAQIDLQIHLLGITKQIDAEKLKQITNDKYQINLEIIALNLKGDIAKANAKLKEEQAKPDQSNAQIALAKRKRNADIEDAKQKAEAATEQAKAQRTVEIRDINKQTEASKELFKYDQISYELKLQGLTIGAYETQLAESANNVAKQKLQIQEDFAKATIDMDINDEKYLALKIQKEQKILEIDTAGKANADYIAASKKKQLDFIDLQMQFAMQNNSLDIEKLNLEAKRYYLTQFEFDKQSEIFDLNKRLIEIEQRRNEAKSNLGGVEFDKENERLNQQIVLEQRLSNQRTLILEQQNMQRTSFSEGWDKAFREYAEGAQNYAQQGAASFAVVTNGMEKAISDFVEKGKFAFGDFVKSIIQGLIKIQIQSQATRLFDSVGGIGGLLKLGMSFLNPAAAGSMGAGGGLSLGGGSGLGLKLPPQMANGGDIDGPTIVGERGPELFIPKGAGTVIPNHKMGDAMSAPSVVYNGPYIASMSAIDTQSATQFLARNKLGVWSANQSAARSLPTSR